MIICLIVCSYLVQLILQRSQMTKFRITNFHLYFICVTRNEILGRVIRTFLSEVAYNLVISNQIIINWKNILICVILLLQNFIHFCISIILTYQRLICSLLFMILKVWNQICGAAYFGDRWESVFSRCFWHSSAARALIRF
jgi:hypothetical protein